jgi:hypothetical protein
MIRFQSENNKTHDLGFEKEAREQVGRDARCIPGAHLNHCKKGEGTGMNMSLYVDLSRTHRRCGCFSTDL